MRDAVMREQQDMIAVDVLLFYLQRNGGLEKAVAALNRAISFVGLKAEFGQDDTGAYFMVEKDVYADQAREFRRDLDGCWPKGDWYDEERAVMAVLSKWKVNREEVFIDGKIDTGRD